VLTTQQTARGTKRVLSFRWNTQNLQTLTICTMQGIFHYRTADSNPAAEKMMLPMCSAQSF